MPTLQALKNNANAKFWVSCTGRSTLDPQDPRYEQAKELARIVLRHGGGVIHGGYSDKKWYSVMQAYADGANEVIKQNNLPQERNIWILMKQFDEKRGTQSHNTNTSFVTPVTQSIDQMVQTVTDNCDVVLVFSHAWSWTLHEVATTLIKIDLHHHYNVTASSPHLVLFGENRHKILKSFDDNLALGTKFLNNPAVHIVRSTKEFEEVLQALPIM